MRFSLLLQKPSPRPAMGQSLRLARYRSSKKSFRALHHYFASRSSLPGHLLDLLARMKHLYPLVAASQPLCVLELPMRFHSCVRGAISALLYASLFASPFLAFAQQPDGPQSDAPPAVAPKPVAAQSPSSSEPITVPAGTRVGVVLQNGISTRSAKPGDSIYLQTSFPITQNNRIVIPVGSYLRGALLESKRPGKIKGKGEFRMRLNTLIFPTGYTVDLNAAPRSADSGGKETMDLEGKITGGSDKGKDVGTVAETTATGAGIGAIACH